MLRHLFFSAFILFGSATIWAGTDSTTRPRDQLLQVGQEAPDFSLPSSFGEEISLSSYKGKKTVVLFFYPRAFSPACTREAEGFRDELLSYDRKGAAIIGISVDEPRVNKQFASKLELTYPLLSDEGGKVARQYGVMGWIMAKRVTYLIGTDGNIKQVFPEINVEEHSHEVLRTLSDGSAPAPSRSRKSKR